MGTEEIILAAVHGLGAYLTPGGYAGEAVMPRKRGTSPLLIWQCIKELFFVVHPGDHGVGIGHDDRHGLHGGEVIWVLGGKHGTGMGLGLGGHLVERNTMERMVAGTTELAAGHGFHRTIL